MFTLNFKRTLILGFSVNVFLIVSIVMFCFLIAALHGQSGVSHVLKRNIFILKIY